MLKVNFMLVLNLGIQGLTCERQKRNQIHKYIYKFRMEMNQTRFPTLNMKSFSGGKVSLAIEMSS